MALLQAEPVGAAGAEAPGGGVPARPGGRLAGVRRREVRASAPRRIAGRATSEPAPSHEEVLRVRLTGRRMLLFGTFVLAALASCTSCCRSWVA